MPSLAAEFVKNNRRRDNLWRQKKGGLGRGLDLLFQDTGASSADDGVTMLRLTEVEPDKAQPANILTMPHWANWRTAFPSTACFSPYGAAGPRRQLQNRGR